MLTHRFVLPFIVVVCAALAIGTLAAEDADQSSRGSFQFEPLPASAVCTPGRPDDQQFVLPPGFVQRVIAREGDGGSTDEWDQNENPDNLLVHRDGRLFIAEDQDEPTGDDIWVAVPDRRDPDTAANTVRFASLFDCVAEPTGIYFNRDQTILFVNVQHRGAPDTRDLAMIITEAKRTK